MVGIYIARLVIRTLSLAMVITGAFLLIAAAMVAMVRMDLKARKALRDLREET